jgi:AcrR family transcriptional regulator
MTRTTDTPQQPAGELATGSHEAILEAARDLIAEGGIEAMSMRAVAERVGVTATAIYHHYVNKQALVDAVVRLAFERFGAEMQAAVDLHPRGSLRRVRAFGEAYVRFAIEHQAYFRIIFSIAAPTLRNVDELPAGAGYPLLRETIAEAMTSGEMCTADPDVMAHYLWAHVHGVVTLALSCRLEKCPQCQGGEPRVALEMFRVFGPLVRGGIAGPAAREDGA